MTRLTIALDCDGVLFSCNDYVCAVAEHVLGREMPPPEEHHSFDFDKALGLSRYEWALVQNKILGGTGTLDMPWLDGAEVFVHMLREQGHDVYFLTSHWRDCPRWVMDREWRLTDAFGPVDVVFTHNKTRASFDFLVDDKSSTIEAVGPERGILFNQPWNQDYAGKAFRAMSYEDVLSYIGSK